MNSNQPNATPTPAKDPQGGTSGASKTIPNSGAAGQPSDPKSGQATAHRAGQPAMPGSYNVTPGAAHKAGCEDKSGCDSKKPGSESKLDADSKSADGDDTDSNQPKAGRQGR